VLVEALVLDRDERLRDVLRQRPNGHAGSHLATDLADRRAVAREDERRLGKRDDLPSFACAAGGVLRSGGAGENSGWDEQRGND